MNNLTVPRVLESVAGQPEELEAAPRGRDERPGPLGTVGDAGPWSRRPNRRRRAADVRRRSMKVVELHLPMDVAHRRLPSRGGANARILFTGWRGITSTPEDVRLLHTIRREPAIPRNAQPVGYRPQPGSHPRRGASAPGVRSGTCCGFVRRPAPQGRGVSRWGRVPGRR